MIRNNDLMSHHNSYNYIHYSRLDCSNLRLWQLLELVLMHLLLYAPTQYYSTLPNLVVGGLPVSAMLRHW
jgi:hypothetical protein